MRKLALLTALILTAAACGGGAEPDLGGDVNPPVQEGDDGDAEKPTETQPPSDGDEAQTPSGLPPSGSGTVSLNGETIEPAWVGNCLIDPQFNPEPGDLDVTVSLDGGLEALFLEVSMDEAFGDAGYVATSFRPELQLRTESGSFGSYEPEGRFVTGPDGTWYLETEGSLPQAFATNSELADTGIALDQPPIVIDGDNITGTFTVDGESGPIEVTFDLNLTEPVDCSLQG